MKKRKPRVIWAVDYMNGVGLWQNHYFTRDDARFYAKHGGTDCKVVKFIEVITGNKGEI